MNLFLQRKKANEMDCRRCQGLMQKHTLIDLEDELGIIMIEVLRCLNCGEVIDPMILKNRATRPKPLIGKARFTPITASAGSKERLFSLKGR